MTGDGIPNARVGLASRRGAPVSSFEAFVALSLVSLTSLGVVAALALALALPRALAEAMRAWLRRAFLAARLLTVADAVLGALRPGVACERAAELRRLRRFANRERRRLPRRHFADRTRQLRANQRPAMERLRRVLVTGHRLRRVILIIRPFVTTIVVIDRRDARRVCDEMTARGQRRGDRRRGGSGRRLRGNGCRRETRGLARGRRDPRRL
jgi:hypothetical protein